MVINGVFWRSRTGCPWRDLPGCYGSWQTVYNRHRRWSAEGTWGQILDKLRCGCDQNAQGDTDPDWVVGADSTVVRAHQHAAGARRSAPPYLVTDSAGEVVCAAEATTVGCPTFSG
jgi:transposase